MAFRGWDKVQIKTDMGESVEAVAPVIVSASRSTDIPAFYADWFMNRLRKGYIKWNNPFNAAQPQYVAFAKTRVVVFWTKNPQPMLKYVDELLKRGLNFYFTFTLNDYVKENFEPYVPSLEARLETFRELSKKIGKQRVIWRFDPLILTDQINVEDLLGRIKRVGEELQGYTEKLVVSFADIEVYPKVKNNLHRLGIKSRSFTEADILQIAQGLQELSRRWRLTVATCGETVSLEPYGIVHNRCIDDELMIRCFREDDALMEFLGVPKFEPMDLFAEPKEEKITHPYVKDAGQRKACGCTVSKDIGQYNTCGHLCAYCYANYSENVVRKNLQRVERNGESILPGL